MTKEEKIAVLKALWRYKDCGYSEYEIRESLEFAIEELLQEPCEDAISRAEIIYELNRLGRNSFKDDTDYDNFFAFVDSLPPVTPTHKKGKWIEVWDKDHIVILAHKCSECGTMRNTKTKYCADCGAEMESEE